MTPQIRKFAITKLTLGATAFFHSQVLDNIKSATPEALHIEDLVEAYEEKYKQLEQVVNRARAYIITKKLRKADAERDRYVGVIMNTVRTHRSNPIDHKRKAAQRLSAVLSGFKGVNHHEQTKQTAEIRSMLTFLAEELNLAAAAELHLEEEIEGLRVANDAFSEAMMKKTEEVSERISLSETKSKDLRAEVRRLYTAIYERVNAYAIVQPTEAIETFISNMNGLIGSMK